MAWGPFAWGRKERKEQARHRRGNIDRGLLAEGYRDAADEAADVAGSAAEAFWEGLEPRTFTITGSFGTIDESVFADLVGSPVEFDAPWLNADSGVVTAARFDVDPEGWATLILDVDLPDGRTAQVEL